jgi:hypothetical protein
MGGGEQTRVAAVYLGLSGHGRARGQESARDLPEISWYRYVTNMRWRLAIGIALAASLIVWIGNAPPAAWTDWDAIWVGAGGVLHGQSPYQAVDSTIRAGKLTYPLYYPATAPVLLAPLGVLPLRLAIAIFSGLGLGLLALSMRDHWRLGMLLSAPVVHAVLLGQWSPWLTAAIGLPWLGFVWVAKPSIGLALFAGWPSRRAAIGCALLLAVSLIFFLHWPDEWFHAIHEAPQYLAPIQRPFGWLLLLAWFRWREPEARLLGALALIPHTTVLHEMLYPMLVARTPRQLLGLIVLGYAAAYLVYTRTSYGPSDVPQMLAEQWPYFLALGYAPALALLLTRSNAPGRHGF